jgi:Zn-dependent peptidase ImmA (M78 family)/transcriptional regulator with XRE-family HTH domain
MFTILQPSLLVWARQRAGLDQDSLARKMGVKIESVLGWEANGRLRMTQVEKLAHVTYTPVGYLYLDSPPMERLPIPDFRTVGDALVRRPSPDLLETVETMQRRQAWMRDYLIEEGHAPLDFVGRYRIDTPAPAIAADMRVALSLAGGWAESVGTWTEALAQLRQRIETLGVLIVINGVVGNNTRRKLSTQEFRGFALCDAHAPFIFINGSDAKSAQMFTLAHELAHLWLGQDGVSNLADLQPGSMDVERHCNAVAAEFLIPATELRAIWPQAATHPEPFKHLARRFKVSPIVAARRALDLGLVSREAFFSFHEHYLTEERRRESEREGGGNFWNTQNVRIGQRFGSAVVRAAKEGRLLYRDAYRLTGLSGTTFDRYVETLGFRL